ncbi:hypothetical protein LWC34_00490 [Kibdelosporangium philippinense]|uniref:Uncharacterized protein n=1 Tax=Kibdelosporangium philippinense TaxID=211113 RepID=A0ABS8Z0E5_9PSEU|nr:hypothetical protein [Kibdelosporangium philippinense]MCE7001325.1 hypothetical protein [Kibdelosporangium philippinense]
MSPVSRGRKGKKNKQQKGPTLPKAVRHFAAPSAPQPNFSTGSRKLPVVRGEWFDEATRTVLDQAHTLLTAQNPLELEQATAELTGAALHTVIHDGQSGLKFENWLSELIDAAAVEAEASEGASRLLYGLAAIVPSKLLTKAMRKVSQLPEGGPSWLRLTPAIEANGDVWRMRDIYRSRVALIADFRYPDGSAPSVFLFDIDMSAEIRFAEPGVFEDVNQAADSWRARVGETATDAQPRLVDSPTDLLPLMHVDAGEIGPIGDETRAQTDNWFRGLRRIQDVLTAREERGLPDPPSIGLYESDGYEALAKEFIRWYAERHGAEPVREVVVGLAAEWLEGILPDAVHSVSPRRVAYYQELIDDFRPDFTAAVKPLFPEWVRWNGEQAGLPQHLIDRAVAEAAF